MSQPPEYYSQYPNTWQLTALVDALPELDEDDLQMVEYVPKPAEQLAVYVPPKKNVPPIPKKNILKKRKAYKKRSLTTELKKRLKSNRLKSTRLMSKLQLKKNKFNKLIASKVSTNKDIEEAIQKEMENICEWVDDANIRLKDLKAQIEVDKKLQDKIESIIDN